MQVTNLVNTDTMSYQYSINGTDYYPLQELQTKEKFGARQMVDLHVKAVGSDNNILSAGNCKIETPRDSDVPTISGTDKFSDRTEVTITTTPGAIVYYTTDDTVPTKGSQQYKTPITLTETTTIKAIAIEDGHIMSDVVGRVFAKDHPAAAVRMGALPVEAVPVEAVPAEARAVAAAHQAVPPTADLKLLRHRRITRTRLRLRLRPKPEKMVQL